MIQMRGCELVYGSWFTDDSDTPSVAARTSFGRSSIANTDYQASQQFPFARPTSDSDRNSMSLTLMADDAAWTDADFGEPS